MNQLQSRPSDNRYCQADLGGSLIYEHRNIAAGELVEVVLYGSNWFRGTKFFPRKFIYAGSPDMWILAKTCISGNLLSGVDIPCDTYRPGADHLVNWQSFQATYETKLTVENRGPDVGYFVGRISGEFGR